MVSIASHRMYCDKVLFITIHLSLGAAAECPLGKRTMSRTIDSHSPYTSPPPQPIHPSGKLTVQEFKVVLKRLRFKDEKKWTVKMVRRLFEDFDT